MFDVVMKPQYKRAGVFFVNVYGKSVAFQDGVALGVPEELAKFLEKQTYVDKIIDTSMKAVPASLEIDAKFAEMQSNKVEEVVVETVVTEVQPAIEEEVKVVEAVVEAETVSEPVVVEDIQTIEEKAEEVIVSEEPVVEVDVKEDNEGTKPLITKELIEQLKEEHKTWAKVAGHLGLTYNELLEIRKSLDLVEDKK